MREEARRAYRVRYARQRLRRSARGERVAYSLQ